MTLPLVASKEVIVAFKRAGFKRSKTGDGSHRVYVKVDQVDNITTVTLLEGKKEISRNTLRRMLDRAGISEKEFMKLLKKKR